MKKLFALSMALLLMTGIASAATVSAPAFSDEPPVIADSSSARDAYGYGWIDNDGGGGPTFNWIDISAIGVPVVGLLDDNNVGPFPMGFQFAYYWYTVDHMWIGSNGYISFSDNYNFAHPFKSIPSPTRRPHDLLAVLVGDLDFTEHSNIRPPACYSYTNNVDTFIVSWINASEFSATHDHRDSTHTFQMILSLRDSSITFQYGENHGTFDNSDSTLIGIENLVGQLGLQYLRANLPANHMWHNGLALKFHAIPNPNYVFHDFGVVDGFHEGSGAVFVPSGSTFALRASVKDYGTRPEDNLKVRCQIRRANTSVFDDTVLIAHMEPAQQMWVDFNRQFTPDRDTTFRVTFSSIMTGDQNSSNNTKICELDRYTLPCDLSYTGDEPSSGRSWNGDFSGFGNEFEMPVAVEVTSVSFYVNAVAAAGPAYVWILPDNGSGQPDLTNHLFDDTVQVTTSGWTTLSTAGRSLIFAANAKFWLVALHAFQSTFDFGMDTVLPYSFRGWEYTGGMAPDRDRTFSDIMMKVHVIEASGISEEIIPKAFSLSQNYPNPFNARTNISFNLDRELDVSINIFNIVGQLVETLGGHYGSGTHAVIWDASQAASGVYFYRVNVGDVSETRKMVLLK